MRPTRGARRGAPRERGRPRAARTQGGTGSGAADGASFIDRICKFFSPTPGRPSGDGFARNFSMGARKRPGADARDPSQPRGVAGPARLNMSSSRRDDERASDDIKQRPSTNRAFGRRGIE